MKNRISDQWVYQWYGNDFGLGLPITGTFSNVNFGFELGKKGLQKQLVQENYANLSVSFSLNDKWFEKRKFKTTRIGSSASCLCKV
jgi:hypothetical protein